MQGGGEPHSCETHVTPSGHLAHPEHPLLGLGEARCYRRGHSRALSDPLDFQGAGQGLIYGAHGRGGSLPPATTGSQRPCEGCREEAAGTVASSGSWALLGSGAVDVSWISDDSSTPKPWGPEI